ncbi:MAG: stage II sporulation protein M [Chitinophagales bacterium]
MISSQSIKDHIKNNFWQYLILIVIFVLGLIAGEMKVSNLTGGTRGHLIGLLNSFMTEQGGVTGRPEMLLPTILNQIKTVGLIWFLGLTVIGVPFILGLVFTRAFSLGFTIGFLVEEKGRLGWLVALASVFPQNLIYLPVLLVGSLFSLNFSMYIIKGQLRNISDFWRSLLLYTLLMALVMAFFIVGALVEAYISPWFLSLIV